MNNTYNKLFKFLETTLTDMFIVVFSLMVFRTCLGFNDTFLDTLCSESDDSIMSNNQYKINLKNLLNSLATDGPIHNGFHTTLAGKNPDKIYGLTLCRGDISVSDCADCIRNVTAVTKCSNSKNVTIWFRWCLIPYSDVSFFGMWDQSAMVLANDTNFEQPEVVAKGIEFMNVLASTAPMQGLMFQTAVMNVKGNGKRYCMAQCTRDISRSECNDCLDYQLLTFKSLIGSKRGWEIHGSSCSLWYHDFQFYFNVSKPQNKGAAKLSPHYVVTGLLVVSEVLFLFLY